MVASKARSSHSAQIRVLMTLPVQAIWKDKQGTIAVVFATRSSLTLSSFLMGDHTVE